MFTHEIKTALKNFAYLVWMCVCVPACQLSVPEFDSPVTAGCLCSSEGDGSSEKWLTGCPRKEKWRGRQLVT